MKEKLSARDFRFIAVCLVLFAAALWFAAGNFYRAFPEASIDFRVSRDEGRVAAARFLAARRYNLAGYRQAASFTYDDDAKVFLERQIGLEQANHLMGTRVRLWRWSYRWFRPLQKEEFRAEITPAGDLAGFDHDIPENAPRPAVTAGQARTLAENFLRGQFHRDPAGLDFVEVSEVARPHRTDRTFTWKERDFNLDDAQNRIEIEMLGDEPGSYREYLKVPEQWTRDYQRMRSRNELAQTVDTAFMLALVVGLVVVIVSRVRRGDVRWRGAAMVGCVAMALSLCSHANEFPLHEFAYPTTDSYASFLSRNLLQAVLGALAAGGFLFVLTAGAEPLYRQTFGGQVALANLFSGRGLRTKRFFLGSILGITLTAIFIAYQTGFYIVAYRFGAWSPADVPYSDLLNTRFPWAFVLFGGFFPAVSEEFLFRLFAIPFLRKLVRWMPAALLLAGFIWGFGHSGYPQQPFFIRGLEVGIGGVALGVIMLRWGILPTLVWHYSVDAMYSAMLLLRSHSLYFRMSGAAAAGIIVLPVAVALIAYWRRGGFEPHTGLCNSDQDAPADLAQPIPAPDTPALIDYRPLSSRARLVAAAILPIGLATLLIPAARFGERPAYKISADQARAAADAFLRSQSLDPASFRHVTFPAARWDGNGELAGKYFLERIPLAAASALFERNRTLQRWIIRDFRSLDKEEVTVSVHPETGRVQGFSHSLAEDAPGADLPPDRAIPIASAFAAAQGWNLGAMDLKESSSEKKKARRDHTLLWEARTGDPRNVGQARFRVQIGVAGDRVSSLGTLWKLPESWERERSSSNLLSILLLTLRIAVVALGIVRGVWMTIGKIRAGELRWGLVLRIAAVTAAAIALGSLLSLSVMARNYPTEIPFETFLASAWLLVLMGAVFGFLMMGGAAALLTSFFPDCIAAMRRANRRNLAADAALALIGAIGVGAALGRLGAVLNDRFPALALISISSPDLIVSSFPALSAIADALRAVPFAAAVLGVFVLIARGLPRRWMSIPLGLLAACAILPTDIHSTAEFALHYSYACVAIVCGALFCRYIARDNYLAYAIVLWTMSLRGPLDELFGTGNPALQLQGWLIAGALLLTLAWALAPALARKPAAAEAAA
jgi:membrane protease YdiL (CAAX protease family)